MSIDMVKPISERRQYRRAGRNRKAWYRKIDGERLNASASFNSMRRLESASIFLTEKMGSGSLPARSAGWPPLVNK